MGRLADAWDKTIPFFRKYSISMHPTDSNFVSSWSRWRYLDRDSLRIEFDSTECWIAARRLTRRESLFWWSLYVATLISLGLLTYFGSMPNEARAILVVLFLGFAASAPTFQSIRYVDADDAFAFVTGDLLFRRKKILPITKVQKISLELSSYEANTSLEVLNHSDGNADRMFSINARNTNFDDLADFLISVCP